MIVQELVALLRLKVDPKELAKAESALDRFAERVSKLKLGEKLKTAAKWFAAGVAAIGYAAVRAAQQMAGIGDAAQRLGVGTEALQGLAFAAQQSGSDFETLSGGLNYLNKLLNDAKSGSAESAKAFRMLGLDAKNFSTSDEAFIAIADKLAALPDGAQKSALAMRLLGKQGAYLLPMMNKGSKGIAALMKRAKELGAIASEADIKKASEFGDKLNEATMAVRGMVNAMSLALYPILGKILDRFVNWWIANKDWIKLKVEQIVKKVTKAFETLEGVIKDVADNWDLLLAAITSVSLAYVVVKAKAIAAGVASAWAGRAAMFAWIKAAAPFLLIVGLIWLAITVIEDLYQAFTGGESVIKEYLWDPMVRWLDDIWAGIEEFSEFMMQVFSDAVKWVMEKIDLIPKKIREAIGGIKDVFSGDFGTVKMTRDQAFGRAGGATANPVLNTSSNSASVVNRQRQSNSIVINTAAGQSAQEIATVVRDQIGGWWDGQLRSAETAVP